MKNSFIVLIILISSLRPIEAQVNTSINQVGFSYNFGVGIHNFSDFSQNIEKYDFIPLEDYCVSGKIELLFGNPSLIWAVSVGLFANLLTEFEDRKYVNFYGYRIGGRLMQNILKKNTFRSRVYLGANASFLNLSFIDGTSTYISPQSFNQFLSSNVVNHIRLSNPRTDIIIGFTFDYVPDWFISQKPHRQEFINIGLDIGYMHSLFENDTWIMRGVRTPNNVSDVPKLNTNHFYFHLTYRFMFDTIFNSKKKKT